MIEECSDEDEAEGMAATYGRIIGILMAQRDSQATGNIEHRTPNIER